MNSSTDRVGDALFWGVVLGHAFLPLEVPIGPLRVPVADLCAGLLGLWVVLRWRHTRAAGTPRWLALLVGALVAWLGLSSLLSEPEALRLTRLHDWMRWPVWSVVVYGLLLPRWIASRPLAIWGRPWVVWAVGVGALSVISSTYRIGAGGLVFIHHMEPFTENHKTLAQALAVALPLLLRLPRRRTTRLALVGLVFTAVALSLSRTAVLALVAGLAVQGLLLLRPKALPWALGVVGAAGSALYLLPPLLLERFSLHNTTRTWLWDKAVALAMQHPWTGAGVGGFGGAAYEVPPPVAADIGLDAHGLLAKLLAEGGVPAALLGGLALGGFVLHAVRRADDPVGRAVAAVAAALALCLLLSTDTWTCTAWVPVAMVLGVTRSPSKY